MAMASGKDDGEPMMDLNMTPLIDVLLVLIIMFIITIPIQTHAVKVDLPQNTQNQKVIDAQKNVLAISRDGVVAWNGIPVDDTTLRTYLDQTKQMNPEPELHFQPDQDARYEVVDHTLAIVKKSEVGKLGFIGNEQYYNDF